MLKNFNLIIRRFNLSLTKKFITKIKLFLRTNPASLYESILNILSGCIDYFNEEKPDEDINTRLHTEIIEFVKFIFNEINFDVEKLTHVILKT